MPFRIEFDVPKDDIIRIKDFAGSMILIDSGLEFQVTSFYSQKKLRFIARSKPISNVKEVWKLERKLKRFNPTVKHVK